MKTSDVKYILIADLDGTCLDREGIFCPEFCRIVKEKNVVFIPCTGRMVRDVIQLFASNKMELPPYIIGDNGAIIVECNKKVKTKIRVLFLKPIPPKIAIEVLECYKRCNGNVELVRITDGFRVISQISPKILELYRSRKRQNLLVQVKNLFRFLENNYCTKIVFLVPHSELEELAKKIRNIHSGLVLHQTGNTIIDGEVLSRLEVTAETDKGEAVKFLMERVLGKETIHYKIAAGDAYSDIPMLKYVIEQYGFGIVVKNADPTVKKAVKDYAYLLKRPKSYIEPEKEYGDGVAEALKKLLDERNVLTLNENVG